MPGANPKWGWGYQVGLDRIKVLLVSHVILIRARHLDLPTACVSLNERKAPSS